jgi:hypothetical protein
MGQDPSTSWNNWNGETQQGKYTDWLDQNNVKYSFTNDTSGGEAGGEGTRRLKLDYSSLPKTKFGTVDNTRPYREGLDEVYDPKYIYDDPTYGKITHYKNLKDKQSWMDHIPTAIMAAASAGMTGLGFPALAMAGINAAKAGGDGDWKGAALNMAMAGLGSGFGGTFQLPPELAQAIKYGKMGYGMYNTGRSLAGLYNRGRGG